MMVAVTAGLFAVISLAGIAWCALGYRSHRHREHLGATQLTAFAMILGVGHVVVGALGLAVGSPSTAGAQPWGAAGLLVWSIAAIPWLLFALQYTGRQTHVRRRTMALLYAPLLILVANFALTPVGLERNSLLVVVTSIVFIYCFALVFIGSFLVIQAAKSYVHLSVGQGVAVIAAPVVVPLAGNAVSILAGTSEILAVGTYATVFVGSTVLFGMTMLGEPFLPREPAVETIGRRAITRETDDLIFVVDADETVVRCNRTAEETLSDAPVPGESIRASLDHDTETLRDRETITLETTAGKRQYDPELSSITDDDGRVLGAVCSLRDVTERELREQRLAVLNRVLRHNLRNKIDVVKSHAETIDSDRGGDHVQSITAAADSITQLGQRARAIDQIVSGPTQTQSVDITAVVEQTVTTLETPANIAVRLDLPETATVETDRRALRGALESAIDNALTYAETAVAVTVEPIGAGYRVVVEDDGPGIPERELESLDAGTETPLQHGTGLGLWQLRWAVTTIGGELSFDTDDGTTVQFTVPNWREDE